MSTGSEGLRHHAMHGLEFVAAARLGNFHDVGIEGYMVKAILRQVESATSDVRSHFCIERIDAILLHVDRVFHPATSLRGCRGTTRSLVVGNALSTLVVLVRQDGARQFGHGFIVGSTLRGGAEHVEA